MRLPKLGKFEWLILAIFILMDIGLFVVTRNVLRKNSPNRIADTTPITHYQEIQTLDRIETLAHSGSWESLERARVQTVESFLKNKTAPSPSRGVSTYFFPELLSDETFEKEFATTELRPGLDALRKAYENRSEQAAMTAFEVLETRVENFELGAIQDEKPLSSEAQRFLRTYRSFTSFR